MSQLKVNGYNLISHFSRKKGYGGVLLLAADDYKCVCFPDVAQFSIENVIEMAGMWNEHNKQIILGIYRPPQGTIENFLDQLRHCIDWVIEQKPNYSSILVGGDFNINLLKNTTVSNQLQELFADFGLQPRFREPSRVSTSSETMIDNIFANVDSPITLTFQPHLSDHQGQILSYPTTKCAPETKEIFKKRITNKSNIDKLKTKLLAETWNVGKCAEEAFDEFWKTLMLNFNQTCPEKTVHRVNASKVRARPKDKSILKMKNELEALETIMKVRKDDLSRSAYNIYRKKYAEKLTEQKRNLNLRKIRNSENKNNTIWKIINKESKNQVRKNDVNLGPDELNKYFTNIGASIAGRCDRVQVDPMNLLRKTKIKTIQSIYLHECTITELRKALRQIKSKQTRDIYGMTSTILKEIFPCIEVPICNMFSKCLEEGYFPDQLKKAKIVPVHKKGDMELPENYRPVSILPVLSKLLEIIIKNRILSFFKHHKIFCKQQHGFLTGRSVETALAEVLENIGKAFDGGQKCSIQACDLSKAFDSVSHSVLLNKLEHYGIRGGALDLMKSYLTDRMQMTGLGGRSSAWEKVSHGVPQGSVLGPLLFVIYINDLPANMNSDQTILFADDTSFLNRGMDNHELEKEDRKTLNDAQIWFNANKLMMNTDKTQRLIFEPKMSSDNHMRLLGVFLQPNLKFSVHIDEMIPRLSRATYAVRRIKQIAGVEAAKIAYFSFFHSILNFGILFWGDTTESSKIFIKQKQVLRILCGANSRYSCRELFPKEKILTVTSILILTCVMYIHDNKEILLKNNFNHKYDTRNQNNFIIPYHRIKVSQLNVNHLAIKIFNKLPSKMKELNRRKLKSELKCVLLNKAYYTIHEYMNDKF